MKHARAILLASALGLLLPVLPGCGDDAPAPAPEPGGILLGPTAGGPGADEVLVPLSGSTPAHVVGTSTFNRFHLRTLGAGRRPDPRPDPWALVADRLEGGDAAGAQEIARAAKGADAGALRAHLAEAPAVPPADYARIAKARAALAAGRHAEVGPLLAGDPPPAGTLLRARLALVGAQALFLDRRLRSASRLFLAAAKFAEGLGWLRGTERALQQAFECQYLLRERVEMLDTLQRIASVQAKQDDALAATWTQVDLGCVLAMLANYDRALDTLDAAARFFRKRGRRDAEAHVLASMGLVYLRRAEYGPALDVLERAGMALPGSRTAGVRAYVQALLGNVYENMGDLDRARQLYDAAQKLLGKQVSVDRGDVLGNLGSVHFDLGKHDDAVYYYEAAKKIFEQLGDDEGTANALFSIGRVKKVQGGYRTALDIYDKALALQASDSAAAARTLGAMAETRLAMGQPDEALDDIDRAMQMVGDGSAPMVRVELLVVSALAQLRKKQPGQAIEKIRHALDSLMDVTAGLADEHVVGVRERRAWVFDAAIAVALKTNQVELAVEFLEHGRAGALLEGLGRGARRALPPGLVQAETRAAQRLASANRRYQEARAARQLKELRAATADVEAARTAYRTVQQRIQRESKRLASVFHPVPDSLAAIRQQLARGDVLVLYTLLPYQAYALVVTPRDARLRWLGNTPEIRTACEDLRVDSREPGVSAPEAVRGRLHDLAQRVLAPLGLPADTRRLLVSPDGPLCYVPFPLLLENADMQVACLPSGTMLRLLAEERERTGEHVLALGDPNYTIEHKGHSLQVYAEGAPLEPLPATRVEVNSITGPDDLRLLGNYATVAGLEEAVKSRERWSVLHLACHGLIDPRTPTLSALALTPDGDDDGFLTALEVYGMSLPADLVVLSGCNTGRGRFTKGEGLVGLMRAFMCAGSPRIVVSLWKVDDAATQALMTRFHALWRKDGLPTALALQRAQREIQQQEAWRHPRYWGAWVLWGLPD